MSFVPPAAPLPSPPPAAQGPAAASPTWNGIARAVVTAWRLVTLFVLGLLAVPVGVLVIPGVVTGVLPWRPTLVVLSIGALGLLLLALVWPVWSWRRWAFRLDAHVFEVRHGVVTRTSQLVPLSRLQHVDLKAGPLERALGLATLVLHTAGTHDASVGLPGLAADEAARLRDHLVALGARGDDGV